VSARSGAADNAGASGNSAPTGGSDDPTIDTHVTVMSSDAYLRRLLPALRMLDNPANENGSVLRTALSKIKGFLSFRKDPSDGAAVAALKGRLKVSQERRSRVISVIASDPNPQRAADVANLVTGDFDGDGLQDVALGVPESDLGRPAAPTMVRFTGGMTWRRGRGPIRLAPYGQSLFGQKTRARRSCGVSIQGT